MTTLEEIGLINIGFSNILSSIIAGLLEIEELGMFVAEKKVILYLHNNSFFFNNCQTIANDLFDYLYL